MKKILINNYQFNLRYAQVLVEDVDEKFRTQAPFKGLENHPAFRDAQSLYKLIVNQIPNYNELKQNRSSA